MADTIISVKEKGAETIVVENSPYDTSSLAVDVYIVLERDDKNNDGSNVILVGSLASGQIANVDIEVPCFFERTGVDAGAVYPCEIIAGKTTDNPIVLASGDDLFVRIGDVAAL